MTRPATRKGSSESRVCRVLDLAGKDGREANDALVLLGIPEAAVLGIIRSTRLALGRVAGNISAWPQQFRQHVLGADLEHTSRATFDLDEEPRSNLLPNHTFGTFLNL